MLLPDDVVARFPDYATLPVYVNGTMVPGSEAGVSVWDHGFLYGDGVFEGVRVYDGGFFALREHLERLLDSVQGIGLDTLTLGLDDLADACARVVRATGLRDAHVRVVVTRGIGAMGLDTSSCRTPTVVVMAYPMPPLLGRDAVRLLSASTRRKAHDSLDPKIKSLNYLDGVLAKLQARHAGMDGALLLDSQGFVAEGSGENVLWFRGDRWFTPSCVGALEGVTRRVLMDLVHATGTPVEEGQYTLLDVYRAQEVLLCGSGAEVVPVGAVDGRRIGDGEAGPRTTALAEAYRAYVRTTRRTEVAYAPERAREAVQP